MQSVVNRCEPTDRSGERSGMERNIAVYVGEADDATKMQVCEGRF